MQRAAGESARAEAVARGCYPWYVLGVLVVVCTLSFIDRQALSILAEQIKADLKLTDTQLGLLYGTLFAIFYTIFGIPLGRLVDNWRRVWIIGVGLALWSFMTLLSGLAHSYGGLALARMGVGVGEATASPAAFSILAAYFVQQRRALAMGTYTAGVYLGMGLSLALGGWISTAWDATYRQMAPWGLVGWQATFIFIGAPGLAAAVWVLTLREPPRLDADGWARALDGRAAWKAFLADIASFVPPFTIWSVARIRGALPRNLAVLAGVCLLTGGLAFATGDKIQWAAWGGGIYGVFTWSQTLRINDPPAHKLIWGRPVVPLAVLGTGCLAMVTYAISFWTAPFAIRTFGVNAADAGAALGIPAAIASAVGVIVGGIVSDVWKQRDSRGRIFTCMIAAASPAPVILLMFRTSDYHLFVMLSPLAYFLANLWAGSIVAIFQDLVLPRMFGTVGAVYLLGSNMIGLALGPYLSGKVATLTGSLQAGVFSLAVAPVVALVTFWLLSRRVEEAERTKVAQAIEAGEVASLAGAGDPPH